MSTIFRIRRRPRPIPCRELVELVTAWLDGALPARDAARVEAHLAACEHCSTYVEQIRQTVALLGAVPPGALSAEAEAALLEAFRGFHDHDEDEGD